MGTSVPFHPCSTPCWRVRSRNPKHVLWGVTLFILEETLHLFSYIFSTHAGHHWMSPRLVGCHWHCWVQRGLWMCPHKHWGNRKGKWNNLLNPSSQVSYCIGLLHNEVVLSIHALAFLVYIHCCTGYLGNILQFILLLHLLVNMNIS